MKTLSEIQNSSSKIVLAGGVFDIIHPGHINTLNAAKKLGDFLVVVIATDKTAVKMKKRKPLHSAQLRQELVSSLNMVDLCIIGNDEDIFKTVDLVKPQVIALGYDQTHQEKFITEGCDFSQLEELQRVSVGVDIAKRDTLLRHAHGYFPDALMIVFCLLTMHTLAKDAQQVT